MAQDRRWRIGWNADGRRHSLRIQICESTNAEDHLAPLVDQPHVVTGDLLDHQTLNVTPHVHLEPVDLRKWVVGAKDDKTEAEGGVTEIGIDHENPGPGRRVGNLLGGRRVGLDRLLITNDTSVIPRGAPSELFRQAASDSQPNTGSNLR